MFDAHAFLAPSAADRWVKCAFSATLEAAYPETEASPESLEGTAAHWVVQEVLEGREPAVDSLTPNGQPVIRQMLEGARMVRDAIFATLGHNWRQMLFVEHRVQIPRVHASKNWGTPDYFAWARVGDRLVIFLWDYKFGHEVVDVLENWQLIDYVAGILDEAKLDGLQEQSVSVVSTIIQPRAPHRDGPVRSWRVAATDLRAHFNILRMAAEAATGPDPKATPDPSACKNCKGRHACEALQRAAFSAAAMAQRGAAFDLDPMALGLEARELHRAFDLLKARVSGLDAQIEATLTAGQTVPGWSMGRTPGRLAWTKPAGEVIALGQMMGVQLSGEPSVLTPTQAKAAGLPASIVAVYAEMKPGASKLIQDDGKLARLTFSSSAT